MANRAAEIFERALERPATERAALLDQECRGDGGLRSRVEVLLRAHDSAGGFLGAPTGSGLPPTVHASGEAPGGMIGRYKLLELIGEGGFGRVFMAEQRDPVVRRVAVKVIKAGMDTAQVVARFEAERQALALMDHPGIATVLDGGAADSGRPYFVMELVKGVPITSYCDAANMPIADRLALFREVCGAVQHAHQKGVIHRDLKPSNILVAERDGRPRPKVIDFGIAKATSGRLTDKTLFTEFRQFVGTPEYMSPEQTMGAGVDVDTRSDIYSLGVMLYELLTGTTPLDPDSLRSADFAEMQRLIREGDTPRPSTRLSTLGTRSDVAAHRRTEPGRLGLLLRGDLDWIVLRALEKDRNRRYDTPGALSDDVRRFLEHEPVAATPPSAGYRVRKFVRRNRGAVIAVALVGAALVLGVIGTSAGLVSAVSQRNRAGRELARATEVKGFITSMLEAVAPGVALGRDTALLRQVLDNAAGRLDAGEVTDPLIEAELRHTIGMTYRAVGEPAIAETVLRRAAEIRAAALGDEHPDTLRSREYMGLALFDLGRLSDAEGVLRAVLDGFRRALGDRDPLTLHALNSLGVTLEKQGRFAEAESAFRSAAEGLETVAPDDALTLTVRFNEGYALLSLGRFSEAETHIRAALESSRRTLGAEDPFTLRVTSAWVAALQAQGRLAEAEPVLIEALETYRRILGPEHPDTLGAINNMGGLLMETGRPAQAEPFFREALDASRRKLGDRHVNTLNAIANMAGPLQAQGRYNEAEAFHLEAIEGMRRSPELGSEHPRTLSAIVSYAGMLRDQKRFDEAEPLAREGYTGFVRILKHEHPRTLNAAHTLGAVLQGLGRLDEAEGLLDKAWRARRTALGPAHPRTLQSAAAYGSVLREMGRWADAERELLRAIEEVGAPGGPPPRAAAVLIDALVKTYDAWHAAEPGAGHDARAAEWRDRLPAPDQGGG